MPTDPLRLRALAQTAIEEATQRLNDGGSRQAWEKEMRAILARAHTAAWLAGTAERLGVPLDSPLLSQARLSRAERADITAAVEEQLKYLRGFVDDMDSLSEAQIAARANLYAGATRSTYSKAANADWSLPFFPGEGTECKTNCGCSWLIDVIDEDAGDADATWLRSFDDSCKTCVDREGGNPYQIREGELV